MKEKVLIRVSLDDAPMLSKINCIISLPMSQIHRQKRYSEGGNPLETDQTEFVYRPKTWISRDSGRGQRFTGSEVLATIHDQVGVTAPPVVDTH